MLPSNDSKNLRTIVATNHEVHPVLAVASALLILLLHLSAWPQASDEDTLSPAQQLLKSIRTMRNERLPVALTVETNTNRSYSNDSSAGDSKKFLIEFVTDGHRYKTTEISYDIENDQEKFNRRSTHLFDGEEFQQLYHYDHVTGGIDVMTVDLDGSSRALRRSSSGRAEGFLNDILPGEGVPIYDILADSPNAFIHDTRENVDDFPCIVLEGDSGYGHHKVWIDPANGYHFRKVEVVKRTGDSLFGKTVGPETGDYPSAEDAEDALIYLLDNVEIDLIDGEYYRTRARITIASRTGGDDMMTDMLEFKCSNILVDPDLDEMNAFSLDIPDGTDIRIVDFPALRYVSKNGQLMPKLDSTIYEIEQSLNAMLDPPGNSTIAEPSRPASTASVQLDEKEDAAPREDRTSVYAALGLACIVAGAAAFLLFRLGGRTGRVDDNGSSE